MSDHFSHILGVVPGNDWSPDFEYDSYYSGSEYVGVEISMDHWANNGHEDLMLAVPFDAGNDLRALPEVQAIVAKQFVIPPDVLFAAKQKYNAYLEALSPEKRAHVPPFGIYHVSGCD